MNVVLDTGALALLQTAKGRRFFDGLDAADAQPHVPAAVLAEWYVGSDGQHGPGEAKVLGLIRVVPVTRAVALAAGQARQALTLEPPVSTGCGVPVPRAARVPSAVDAIVVGYAASLSGSVVVYTSDVSDLERLRGASGAEHVTVRRLP